MGDEATLLRSAAGIFWAWVPPAALQATALLVAAALADRLLPKSAPPELREALWAVALLKLVVPPAWASPFALPIDLPPAFEPLAPGLGFASGDGALVADDPSRWALPLAALWLAGVALGATAWAIRARAVERRLRALRSAAGPEAHAALARAAARLGVGRLPALWRIAGNGSPFVRGVVRPAIHLPESVAAHELEHVLLHELAHVARRDALRRALAALLHLLFWFHPLLPFARRRLAAASEAACDRRVAKALAAEAPAYRATLLDFYRRAAAGPGLAFVAPPTALRLRLEAIAAASAPPSSVRRAGGVLLVALFALGALPLAARAERAALEVAEWVVRPPGCLQLRFLVLQRLAAEQQRATAAPSPER